jgi:hypothetical protein
MLDPLDQTSLLCDPFYILKPSLGRDKKGHVRVEPGQLVWAHQVYPTAQPMVIEVKGYDPRDESKNTYVFAKYDPSASPRPHFPVKEMNLRADENLYVMYGKRRPALVIQTISTDFYNQQNPEPYIWVAPCFTFKDKHKLGYRVKVAAMSMPHLFYLPAHASGVLEPSVLRFEHIQPVAAAGVEPVLKGSLQRSLLSDAAWALLQHRLHFFVSGRILDPELEETICAYRDCINDAYQASSSAVSAE